MEDHNNNILDELIRQLELDIEKHKARDLSGINSNENQSIQTESPLELEQKKKQKQEIMNIILDIKNNKEPNIDITSKIIQIYTCSNDIININIKHDALISLFENTYFINYLEQCLIKIKFPLFEGLSPLNEKSIISNSNNNTLTNEITITNKYFSMLSEISTQEQEQFLSEKEIVSEFMYKKTVSSIFTSNTTYKTSNEFIETFDTFISYITQAISNISDLIIYFNLNENKTNIIHFILNNLFTQLNTFFLSTYSTDSFLSSIKFTVTELIMLIQKVTDFTNLVLIKIYNYNPFQLTSLCDWINNAFGDYYNIVKDNQSKFNTNISENIIKNSITGELNNKTFVYEEIHEQIKMIIQDNLNVYMVFRRVSIFKHALVPLLKTILSEYRKYYNNIIHAINFEKEAFNNSEVGFIKQLVNAFQLYCVDMHRTLNKSLPKKECDDVNKELNNIIDEIDNLVEKSKL